MSLLWGLGLGLGDGIFYVLARETYDIYLKANKLNSIFTSSDIWKVLFSGALLGILAPLGYLWAAYSVGGLLDVHIIRCLVSLLFSIAFSSYVFKDTINGWRYIGLGLAFLGLFFVILSTQYN